MDGFRNELTKLLNNYGWDNACETPDKILADYIVSCLENYCATTAKNRAWHSVWKREQKQVKTGDCKSYAPEFLERLKEE